MKDDHITVDVTHEEDEEDGNAAEFELAEAENEEGDAEEALPFTIDHQHPALTDQERADLDAFRQAANTDWAQHVGRPAAARVNTFNESLEKSREFAREEARKIVLQADLDRQRKADETAKALSLNTELRRISEEAYAIQQQLDGNDIAPSLVSSNSDLQRKLASLAGLVSDLADVILDGR